MLETPTTVVLPSGPRGYPFLGILPDLLRDPVACCTAAAAASDGIVRLSIGPATAYLVSHPDYIKQILVDNNRNYWKGTITQRARFLLGQGLITSDGDLWRNQRRLMQPAFHKRRIEALGELIIASVEALLTRWEHEAIGGRELDLAEEMSQLAMDVIVRAMFSTSVPPAEARELGHAFSNAFAHVNTRLFTFFLPEWVYLPGRRAAEQSLKVIDRVIYRVIDERRRSPADRGDLLALLLAARDEEGGGMSDTQLHDEVATIFGAGHETTATALTWTWYLLDRHPAVAERLYAELDAVLGGRPPTIADLSQLNYTRMVIEESMRILPPVWIYFRMPYNDDQVGSYRIPAGTPIFLSPYATHHDPRWWPEPERFDPERFSAEQVAARHRLAYFPFSSGQRSCIGSHLAMIEAQMAIAMIAQRYRFRLRPGHVVRPQASSTLQPRGGMPMIALRRTPSV